MPAIAESQMHERATLLPAFMRQDEREFRRNAFLDQSCEPLEPDRKLVEFAGDPRGRVMDQRTVHMIVESDSKEPATRVTEPKDAEVKDQRSRDGHEKQFLGLRALGLTQAVANPLFQSGGYRHFAHGLAQPPAHTAAVLCFLCARRAVFEVLDHLEIAFGQQFVVDVRIELGSKLLARLLAKTYLSHNVVSFRRVLPIPYVRAKPARCSEEVRGRD